MSAHRRERGRRPKKQGYEFHLKKFLFHQLTDVMCEDVAIICIDLIDFGDHSMELVKDGLGAYLIIEHELSKHMYDPLPSLILQMLPRIAETQRKSVISYEKRALEKENIMHEIRATAIFIKDIEYMIGQYI